MQSVIKLVSVISLSGVSSVSGVKEWNYEIVRNSGKFCPEKDSCQLGRRQSRDSVDLDWKSRNCYCDSFCVHHGDCCIDSKFYDPESQRQNYGKFECRNFKQYGNIWVRSQCPADWSGSEKVKTACESDTEDAIGDPVAGMPVTNTRTPQSQWQEPLLLVPGSHRVLLHLHVEHVHRRDLPPPLPHPRRGHVLLHPRGLLLDVYHRVRGCENSEAGLHPVETDLGASVVQVHPLLLSWLAHPSSGGSHGCCHWHLQISSDSWTVQAWILRIWNWILLVFKKICTHCLLCCPLCHHHVTQSSLLHHVRLLCLGDIKIHSKDHNIGSKDKLLPLCQIVHPDGSLLDHWTCRWYLRQWLCLVCLPHPQHSPGSLHPCLLLLLQEGDVLGEREAVPWQSGRHPVHVAVVRRIQLQVQGPVGGQGQQWLGEVVFLPDRLQLKTIQIFCHQLWSIS